MNLRATRAANRSAEPPPNIKAQLGDEGGSY